ncbi:hypothetical protein HELRODRAFT_160561 [Helobdella robusta]|uniref:Ion transport domain-containing protein n=1 Tax=Helobdella robusta TaxID=6412 RepID=T1EQF1_HELRO|nr:hypothetical protein HELRODRAFT_160561 [Helobdella robusta]ESO06391.1 hypothetical protein HELRODRAFT_160561 [Helobdella robusta]
METEKVDEDKAEIKDNINQSRDHNNDNETTKELNIECSDVQEKKKTLKTSTSHFHRLTEESLIRIGQIIEEEKSQKLLEKADQDAQKTKKAAEKEEEEDDKPKPDPDLEAGKPLPNRYRNFQPELFGVPLEDFDEFYHNRYTFVVLGKDRTIFRFSASKAFFLLSPFHPLRRLLFVMVVILVNCVFMAMNHEFPAVENTFLGIYTVEGSIKMLARGFIMEDFTYLRDSWNWLDFFVVVSAIVGINCGIHMMGISFRMSNQRGNLISAHLLDQQMFLHMEILFN